MGLFDFFKSKKEDNKTVNLGPGESIPKSGKYRCDWCGKGGAAELLSILMMKEKGIDQYRLRELHQKGKQKNIRYFKSGNIFPACPNCGPQTGWTLIEEGTDASKENGAVISETSICDVCDSEISRPEGYLLTTTDVIKSFQYWEYFYSTRKNGLRSQGIESYDDFVNDPLNDGKTTSKRMLINQKNPWLICPTCISLLNVDIEQARKYAKEWWTSDRVFRPPGSGPAPESVIQYFDKSSPYYYDGPDKYK